MSIDFSMRVYLPAKLGEEYIAKRIEKLKDRYESSLSWERKVLVKSDAKWNTTAWVGSARDGHRVFDYKRVAEYIRCTISKTGNDSQLWLARQNIFRTI